MTTAASNPEEIATRILRAENTRLRRALRGVRIAWVSLAVGLIVGLALQVDQAIEAVRVSIIDKGTLGHRVWLTLLFGFGLDLSLWYWARVLHYLVGPDNTDRVAWRMAVLTPRFCGIIPGISLTIAVWRALHVSSEFSSGASIFWTTATALLLIAAPLVLYVGRGKWFGVHLQQIQLAATGVRTLPRTTRRVLMTTLALGILALAWFTTAPGAAIYLGPIAVIFSAAIIWTSLASVLDYFGARIGVPILLVLLAFALVLGLLDCNDDHEVRHLQASTTLEPISTALPKWLHARADLKDYAHAPAYPVVVVSAEGGGIYAAYHAAYVLSRLQDDTDGAFSRHVFAISGVSGGSVGSAYFAAMASRLAENRPRAQDHPPKENEQFVPKTERLLARDFLSPVLAAMLYPDLVQRMIPHPIGALDRARALENSFTRSWTHESDGDEFTNRFDLLGKPGQDAAPALFFNSTEVETGRKVVISRLKCDDSTSNLFYFFDPLEHADAGLSLCSAATLSARFPIVTPPGFLYAKDGNKRRYVDGGYYDNTGADTLAELITTLLAYNTDAKRDPTLPKIRLIVLRIGWADPEDVGHPKTGAPTADPVTDRGDRYQTQGLGDILSPIRTLLNTRGARGEAAVRGLRAILNLYDETSGKDLSTKLRNASPTRLTGREFTIGNIQHRYLEFTIHNTAKVKLPLGWLLSGLGRESIREQTDGAFDTDGKTTLITAVKQELEPATDSGAHPRRPAH